MRSDKGQAVVDYLGLLALAAAVLAVAAAVVEPAGIGSAVGRALARGICVVRGGSCDADQQPCVVASKRVTRGRHASIKIIRWGKDRYVLREQRSDGTIALTDFRAKRLGVGASKRLGGVALGAKISASLLMQWGSGATYVLSSRRAADRLERTIASGDGRLPAPSERFGERRTQRDYGVDGSVLRKQVAGADFQARDRDGTRVAADGSRTVVYEHGQGGSAEVLGRPVVDRDEHETYAVRFDPRGRPLELIVSTGGKLDGAAGLPSSVAPVAAALLAAPAEERAFSVDAHLDLGDPVNAAIARDFVDDVRHPRPRVGSVLAPADRLRDQLRREGTIEARAYGIESEKLGDPDGIGFGSSTTVERSTLLAAMSRGYDGAWRSRDDCMP